MFAAIVILGSVFIRPAEATISSIIVSTKNRETQTLGGLAFRDADLAAYDTETDAAELFFDGSLFSENENIDAVSVLDSGHIVLSTTSWATLGGLDFGSDDLVEYDPETDTSTLFFDSELFTNYNTTDIDAVHVLDSENIILSTKNHATLGGLSFGRGDLVEYNLTSNTASLFFSADLFKKQNTNIDAVHVLDSGNVLLSTTGSATLGGLNFKNGDLVEYNMTANTASIYYVHEGLFGSNVDIDAVAIGQGGSDPIPEPATIALLGLGFLTIIHRRK